MKDTSSVEVDLGGKPLVIEAGRLAPQAAGAVTVRFGDTMLFCAATASKTPREGIDYFPLQVEYREKFYAAGRFPGGFFKREARPAEKEILTARFTDRPIRPLFPEGERNDVQVNAMLLSADGENDADVLNMVAASSALTLSELPFRGPIAGVRIGRVNGEFVVNPTHTQMQESDLDLVYAGLRELPVMIEGSAREISEVDLVAAMKLAQEYCVQLIDAQLELRNKLGLPEKAPAPDICDEEQLNAARELAAEELAAAYKTADKQERQAKLDAVREALQAKLLEKNEEISAESFRATFESLETEVVRRLVLDENRRPDGRGPDDLRELDGQVGLLPRAHGSALFSRGETQALGSVTLGTISDGQKLDAITGGSDEKRFMLHYNFPPYCVGEAGRIMGPGRREVGHGALAERCLLQIMPDDYAYTVRLVSDIMSSNGSSSMASVCVGCLALMDAGVPIKKPVAGISIGLFSSPQKNVLVTDIMGAEDHYGDMDFKVAGTRDGITGFQVDLKIPGLAWDLVEGAFEKARTARGKLLDFMATVIEKPRDDLSPHAPRIHQMKIDPEKIGAVIGPGGKIIRGIQDATGVQIDIEDDGTVSIFSADKDGMEAAVAQVEGIVAEAEEGVIYEGKVTSVKDFGAFVEVLPGTEGLCHISELADFRVGRTEDVCKIGDVLKVKCIGVEGDRIRLSRRAAMQDLGEETPPDQRPQGSDRYDRDRDHGDRRDRGDRGDRSRGRGDRSRHDRGGGRGDRGGRPPRRGGDRGGDRSGGRRRYD